MFNFLSRTHTILSDKLLNYLGLAGFSEVQWNSLSLRCLLRIAKYLHSYYIYSITGLSSSLLQVSL